MSIRINSAQRSHGKTTTDSLLNPTHQRFAFHTATLSVMTLRGTYQARQSWQWRSLCCIELLNPQLGPAARGYALDDCCWPDCGSRNTTLNRQKEPTF